MEDIIKVILLSLIEGITEFLPISSTGHLIVGTAVLNFDRMGALFEIFIQLGAVVAVILYYRATFIQHAREVRTEQRIQRFWFYVFVAFVPAAGTGFLFEEPIEAVLFSPVVVAISLIVGGIVFLVVERLPRFRDATQETEGELTAITLRQAMIVGFAQVLALIPGMSRSGTSIVGGLLSGMNRQIATEFSFFLAIPTLGGATIYKLTKSISVLGQDDLALLILGTVLSGVFAWFAIDWLLKFISHNSFIVFGYYRIFAGIIILILSSAGII